MQPFWQALYDYGADIVLSGHEHDYERFAPQTPDGVADTSRGIREFIVGTGGAPVHSPSRTPRRRTARSRNDGTCGVLKLTLSPTELRLAVSGRCAGPDLVTDSGSSACVTNKTNQAPVVDAGPDATLVPCPPPPAWTAPSPTTACPRAAG